MWISRKEYEELRRIANRNADAAQTLSLMRMKAEMLGLYVENEMVVMARPLYEQMADEIRLLLQTK